MSENNGSNGMMQFSDKFDDRPLIDQLDYLKKLCNSQNHALDLMQKERNEWRDKANQLAHAVENAQQAFDNQKAIINSMVTKANSDNQENGLRIHDLERKVGELGGDLN